MVLTRSPHSLHTCSPSWWARPAAVYSAPAGRAHSLLAIGTTLGFAEAQLHAAELTAFQKLLGRFPGIANAIIEGGRFPHWEAVAGDDAEAGWPLVYFLHCRRLGEWLMEPRAGCRAILTAFGWQQLSGETGWRDPLPDDAPEDDVRHAAPILRRWLEAILTPRAAPAEDTARDIRELAACSFARLPFGGWIAPLSDQAVAADCEVGGFALMDALGDLAAPGPPAAPALATVHDMFRNVVGAERATRPALHAALVAALNPPLCMTILDADDALSDSGCLHPGRRFERLCHAVAALDPLDARASHDAIVGFVDTLSERCGWPKHSALVARATAALEALKSDPAMAPTLAWLADSWTFCSNAPRHPPPATYACTRWVGFVDAFVRTHGGLLLDPDTQARAPFRCEPGLADATELPPAAEGALLHHAAIRVARALVDGAPLVECMDAALAALPPAFDPEEAAAGLAVVLKLHGTRT